MFMKPVKHHSQEMRWGPEVDPLRIGCGWDKEDLAKPWLLIESSGGDSHPGSVHLPDLVNDVREGASKAGLAVAAIPARICAMVSPRGLKP